MEFAKLDPAEMPFEAVVATFQGFRREPWLEVARCPSCNPPDNFGAAGRYPSFGSGWCRACGRALEVYWSDERVKRYLQLAASKDGFVGYVGKDEHGSIVVWAWGYNCSNVAELRDQPEGGFYADTFGSVPPHGKAMLHLLAWSHEQVHAAGAQYFITRTHCGADYVKAFLSQVGYRFLRLSEEEEDREFWIYQP